jgi:hypothetical protein
MTIEVCVKVTEARNLETKDPNGKSDPFYLIGLSDDTRTKFKDVKAIVRSKVRVIYTHSKDLLTYFSQDNLLYVRPSLEQGAEGGIYHVRVYVWL